MKKHARKAGFTHDMASDCALKARRTEPYASCSSWWIWDSMSSCILGYEAEFTADLPFTV